MALKKGSPAPDFRLPNQHDELRSPSHYTTQGHWIVLYFYPKDNTPGCTLEARDFTTLANDFKKHDAIILGVSRDTPKSHCSFIDKHGLTIELLSDSDHKVQELYGVWRPKKFMGREFLGTIRSTFLISPDGNIARIWDPVSAKGHAQEVLKELHELHPLYPT